MKVMEQRIADKADVWHLIERGELSMFMWDLEAYGLNTKFAELMSIGYVEGDIAGNMSGSGEVHVKANDRSLPRIEALLVTQTSPYTLEEEGRWPHRVAVAKFLQLFEKGVDAANKFAVPEQSRPITTIERKGADDYPKHHIEDVYHYPLFDRTKKMQVNEKGEIVTDPPGMLRLNEKGQVLIGEEGRLVTIPHKEKVRQPDGKYEMTTVYRPMTLDDGAIVFDVRIHPRRNKIAVAFDKDPRSPYYRSVENQFYVDGTKSDDGSEKQFKFIMRSLLNGGFRAKWYDNSVIRGNLLRAGVHASNTFLVSSKANITTKQRPKNHAIDSSVVAKQTHLFGPQGEERLKMGSRIDNRTGETVVSAKLGLIMKANSRYENRQRGIRAGVTMPDGSLHDERKGHKRPGYDAEAAFSLYHYCREIAPNLVKNHELQSDEEQLKTILPDNNLMDQELPVFCLQRSNSYEDGPHADPYAYIGYDDQQGKLRRSFFVRLNLGDFRSFTYKGKTLAQMAQEDLSNKDSRNFLRMIKEQASSPEALVKTMSFSKFTDVVKLEEALHSEDAQNWDLEVLDDNYRYLMENPDIEDAIASAIELRNIEMRAEPPPANPRMEDEALINGFGTLDFLEEQASYEEYKARKFPDKGKPNGIAQTLLDRAQSEYNHHNGIDEMLHLLLIHPQQIDLYGYDDTLNLRAAVEDYWDLFKKVHQKLNRKDSPYVFLFDEYKQGRKALKYPGQIRDRIEVGQKSNGAPIMRTKILTPAEMSESQLEQAIEEINSFRWGAMKRMLDDDEAERNDPRSAYGNGLFEHAYSKKGRLLCGNLSRNYRLIDKQGREITFDYIKKQYAHQPHVVQQKLESKEWRFQFLRMSSEPTTSVILMQFADMDRLDELPQIWQYRYRAMRALHLWGPSNEDATRMRWDAIPVLERALLALEINQPVEFKGGLARVFSDHVAGEGEIFLKSDEGQRFLAEYKRYLEDKKAQYPLEDSYKATMHYDVETGVSNDWIEHKIDPKKHIVIEVPDTHLNDPLEDSRHTPYALIIKALDDDTKTRIRRGEKVVLKGMQTGRLYYPGPVDVMAGPRGASYADFIEQAQRAYEDDAGVPFPADGSRNVLRVQKLIPIVNNRPVVANMQGVKVPERYFDGLVAPRLAYFKNPVTALALPADYCPQQLEEGAPIRLRQMKAEVNVKIDGNEGRETGHIYETRLKSVRRITIGALQQEIRAGKLTDDDAQKFGYAGAPDMLDKINAAFLKRETASLMDEELLLLEIDPVNKKSWAYFNPPVAPRAAFVREGEVLSPSAYRRASVNDNPGRSGLKASFTPKP